MRQVRARTADVRTMSPVDRTRTTRRVPDMHRERVEAMGLLVRDTQGPSSAHNLELGVHGLVDLARA